MRAGARCSCSSHTLPQTQHPADALGFPAQVQHSCCLTPSFRASPLLMPCATNRRYPPFNQHPCWCLVLRRSNTLLRFEFLTAHWVASLRWVRGSLPALLRSCRGGRLSLSTLWGPLKAPGVLMFARHSCKTQCYFSCYYSAPQSRLSTSRHLQHTQAEAASVKPGQIQQYTCAVAPLCSPSPPHPHFPPKP